MELGDFRKEIKKMIIKEELNNWRENEFQWLKATMHKKQVEEVIDLYSTYSDVLNSKEKRELKKLKKKQCHFIVIGSAKKSK